MLQFEENKTARKREMKAQVKTLQNFNQSENSDSDNEDSA